MPSRDKGKNRSRHHTQATKAANNPKPHDALAITRATLKTETAAPAETTTEKK